MLHKCIISRFHGILNKKSTYCCLDIVLKFKDSEEWPIVSINALVSDLSKSLENYGIFVLFALVNSLSFSLMACTKMMR